MKTDPSAVLIIGAVTLVGLTVRKPVPTREWPLSAVDSIRAVLPPLRPFPTAARPQPLPSVPDLVPGPAAVAGVEAAIR